MRPLVRTAALNGYVELSRSLGMDPQVLMQRVGLEAAALTLQDRWISGAAVARLLAISAAESGREDFGLRMSGFRRLGSLGPISIALREEPDVRSVLELLLHHEHMYNEALHARLSERDGLVTLNVGLDFGEALDVRQATELAVGAFHLVLRMFLGPQWLPLSVDFAHGAPADRSTHQRVFGPAVEFGRECNGINFRASDLDSANTMSDPLLRTYARQYFEAVAVPKGTGTVDQVRELIEILLPTGRCSVDRIARSLNVDRRSVHRRLTRSGETFSSLVNSVRLQLAEQFVVNPRRSLTEISDLLGFSTASAFSRWFREQFGCSPREWRGRATTGSDLTRSDSR
ncbi:AraC family transcriptional regulator [Streptomyces sp. NBC_00859]|uniref:AraC family transcriptional regulator n=1 Tax=Streptomyces sp. NBC_00859 TaxID=2903682 RepID=UPI003870219F|nr:AraC family transcriptional regulator [Streptomyces sp. NBC_00859]